MAAKYKEKIYKTLKLN